MFNPKKLATQLSTATFRDSRFIATKPKEIFQGFTTQNKAFGMGTVVWKKGEAGRKLKTLDYWNVSLQIEGYSSLADRY